MSIDPEQPRVFLSYSSAEHHDEWVRRLAERLTSNGIYVVFDQWDVALGDDLPHFMETGLSGASRVICVCSDAYVEKANNLERGVGYEKKILSGDLLMRSDSSHIVPVIRDNSHVPPVPTFLTGARYLDFREDSRFEEAYVELTLDLYGKRLHPRPPMGESPFHERPDVLAEIKLRTDPTPFATPDESGKTTLRYEDNNGRFTFGSGSAAIKMYLATAGHGSIYIISDDPETYSVALASDTTIDSLANPLAFDMSSRGRLIRVGDVGIVVNQFGRVGAFAPRSITVRETDPEGIPRMTFDFALLI